MSLEKPSLANIMLIYYYYKYLKEDFTLDLAEFSKKYGLKESSVIRRTYSLKQKGYMRFDLKGKTFEFTHRGLSNACYKWDHCMKYSLAPIKYPLHANLIRLGILEQPETVHILLD